MFYPLYEKAKKLLEKEFNENFKVVAGSLFHEAYMNEKFRHSLQVSGAGNGILAHEAYFQDKSKEFVDVCKTAILLHDIFRFREIRGWFETGQKIDHGEKGAEFLAQTVDFNDVLITLPIKHHGHMIENLYEDEEYKKLDNQTKKDVEKICFAVRDADKIANWNLLRNELDEVKEVWFPHFDDFSQAQSQINGELWSFFENRKVAPNNLPKTNAEIVISTICWIFDINYLYSILYCQKLDLFKGMCEVLKTFEVDEKKIKTVYQVMTDYVLKRFNVRI